MWSSADVAHLLNPRCSSAHLFMHVSHYWFDFIAESCRKLHAPPKQVHKMFIKLKQQLNLQMK